MFKLIENGEVYTPKSIGRGPVLLAGSRIARVGAVDPAKLEATGLGFESVDATSCYVVPGFIDPHDHIQGAGGEHGYASRAPEIQLSELLKAGITTVVGCLGTDATTRHLTSLLAKARGLEAEGVTSYIYTGNYQVPTPTITGSVRDDIVIIDKVIGAGEIAISDYRSTKPSVAELARLVSECVVGSLLSGKAGVTHFHTGAGKSLLSPLHALLDEYSEIPPEHLYATHISRSEALMDDAIALAKRGAYVDIDTYDPDIGGWLNYYMEHGGPIDHLTISSDAHAGNKTNRVYEEFVMSIQKHKLSVERILPFLTLNTATALKLGTKGRIQEGADADVLVIKKDSLELLHVFALGQHMVKDGQVIVKGHYED